MLKRLMIKLFKHKTKQERERHALYIRQKLSLFYAIIAWHCFGLGFIMLVKDKMPDDPVERRQTYTRLLGVNNTLHVYQAHGLSLTDEFDVTYMPKVSQEEKEADKEKITDAKLDEH